MSIATNELRADGSYRVGATLNDDGRTMGDCVPFDPERAWLVDDNDARYMQIQCECGAYFFTSRPRTKCKKCDAGST